MFKLGELPLPKATQKHNNDKSNIYAIFDHHKWDPSIYITEIDFCKPKSSHNLEVYGLWDSDEEDAYITSKEIWQTKIIDDVDFWGEEDQT